MKITYRDILHAHAAFQTFGGLELPVEQALKVARITRFVRTEAEIALDLLQGLVAKHAEKDDKGKPVSTATKDGQQQVKLKDGNAYTADVKKVNEQTAEFTGDPITIADLGGKVNTAILDAFSPWLVK